MPGEEGIRVIESCGNVFEDLGLENPEEELARAQACLRIYTLIQERGLTQRRAAEIMGLAQPDVSNIIRGRTERFSLERLLRCLNDLGQDVVITIQPSAGGKRGRLSVAAPTPQAS